MNSLKELFPRVSRLYGCQNRIEDYYHHDEEQLGFYKRVHMKT